MEGTLAEILEPILILLPLSIGDALIETGALDMSRTSLGTGLIGSSRQPPCPSGLEWQLALHQT